MNTLSDDLVVYRYKAKNIVENFLDLGIILKEIKDNEKWKEKGYDTFKHCVTEEQLASLGFAYKLIQVVEDKQLTNIAKKLGISKTMELLYAPVEEREEIAGKTEKEQLSTSRMREEVNTVKKKKFFSDIHRRRQREDKDLETETDSLYDKGLRQGNSILQDYISIKVPLNDLSVRFKRWCEGYLKRYNDEKYQNVCSLIKKEKEVQK